MQIRSNLHRYRLSPVRIFFLNAPRNMPVVKFPVSHNFSRDTFYPVVIRSISEHFCDYHGTWLSPGYNHRNFQKWVISTELSGHDVSCGNLWDTVRHGKLYHRQYCMPSYSPVLKNAGYGLLLTLL